jgi:transposase
MLAAPLAGAHRFLGREGASPRIQWKRGKHNQAIGRSPGGRTTEIHALTDRFCRPLAFLLTGGQVADCKAGALLLQRSSRCRILLPDKSYYSDAIRRQIEATGAAPNIPPESKCRWKPCFSPDLYKGRDAIERMFGRLKDFCRIATRYDRLATNYLVVVWIAATVTYWV